MIFKGVFTALITPFKDDKLDYYALNNLLDKQIAAGVDGIIVGGSTGEGSSLSEEEHCELIAAAVKHSKKRMPIIAGVNAVSTREATQKVTKLCQLGVDGLMCTAPHYIRPEQSGLVAHYKAISAASSVPIMLYIHPVRTACDFSDETLLEIAQFRHISSIKDATNDLEKPLRVLPKVTNLTMLTGNDPNALAYNANGGAGCVSVIANIVPKLCKKIDNFWRSGEIISALELQQKLSPLFDSIFMESNPIGIKYAVSKMNLCSNEIRLPLTEAKENSVDAIDVALKDLIIMENNV
ncbi:MAG: 4-hydroxy-tetrahydrodipicolinate synthase [Rickettsiaceae bacterium]|nr:4-hydroxy-tetrahydrodipicolinate synthase [Rickettsiaceae bacterium]MDP4832116.1 4-hydroxy-tetrahydrodipicolinate synthase [Rickettsiaceae bacterium]MDP5020312.1 4-hydroxy-tetrahydrodipicolinate synthase [Rickettsiaceae bacterium]MDP5082632.1 4-hydroxy-tetrahydrodipicolinate synthase [Rickettsiaceae bacterium]